MSKEKLKVETNGNELITTRKFNAPRKLVFEAHSDCKHLMNWWGPREFGKAIDAGASDYLMPDVMKTFGVTGWIDVAAQAEARKLPVSSHLFPEISAQLLAATPTAHWLEYVDWWSPVLAEPLEVRDGMAIPADRPGSGGHWK